MSTISSVPGTSKVLAMPPGMSGTSLLVRPRRTAGVLVGLGGLLLGCSVVAIGHGMVTIAPGQMLAILAQQLHLQLPWTFTTQQEMILLAIRLPRVLLGILIGAGLAVSGAAMQGLFRNPLADPGLIGVASGAALAVVVVIVMGATVLHGLTSLLGPFTLPSAAFLGGMLTTAVVYRLASQGRQTSVATMLLAGIAINALAGAGTGLFTFVATDVQLRTMTFWSLGSLGAATWSALLAAAPFLLAAILLLPRLARQLNVLLLGEAEARHLGIQVEHVKRTVVILGSLAVGAAVSVAGIIGFLGLVVPHLLRLAIGPDHRALLPGVALCGASLLLGADLVARTLVAPAELPLGIVTALLGAPFFLYLLLRHRGQWSL